MTKPIIGIMYDFDKTLSPKDMQEYGFVPGVGMEPVEFWDRCNRVTAEHGMDPILSYMWVMLQEAEGKMLLTREKFNDLGKNVELFQGVATWFQRINKYGESKGAEIEHYIISSGLKEIIEGTKIAKEFKKIYAAKFCYSDKNVPVWPAIAVNYTSKTQFLFRINKGVLDITEHNQLNEFMPEDMRRIPFRNMIYIGDGYTDVPCMKLVKVNSGHSIAVYQEGKEDIARAMIKDGRVDFALPANYSRGGRMEKTVHAIIDKMTAVDKVVNLI